VPSGTGAGSYQFADGRGILDKRFHARVGR
jgi:hypothetical protein